MDTVQSLIVEVRNELRRRELAVWVQSGNIEPGSGFELTDEAQTFLTHGQLVSKLNQVLSLLEDEEPAGMKDETVQMQNYSDPEPARGMSHEIFNPAKPKE